MTAGWLVWQLRDVLVPLPWREVVHCGADPLDGVLDVQVPQPCRRPGAGRAGAAFASAMGSQTRF